MIPANLSTPVNRSLGDVTQVLHSPASSTNTLASPTAREEKDGQAPPKPSPNSTVPDPFFRDAEEVLRGRYVLGPNLGRGTFAKVYRATDTATGNVVAIKVVHKDLLDRETALLLKSEQETLGTVSQHPGVVTFYDSIETDKLVCFILEYVAGGPLLDKIVERGSFSENDARIALRPILRTLAFMAVLGVVHRDIKPENMLVDDTSDEWPVKLTDFGLSAKLQKSQRLYSICGTPMFAAPELLSGKGYDCSCDMWSIGVTLYTILCGYPPFFDESITLLIQNIIIGQFSFPAREWDRVSSDAKDIVRKMLTTDPESRITAADALAHPWFSIAQSTNALPNDQLKSFNAKRKMRSAFLCVRTTVNFLALLKSDQTIANQNQSRSLLEEVQRNAAAIAELDRLSGRTGSRSIDDDCKEASSDQLVSKSRSGSTPVTSILRSIDDSSVVEFGSSHEHGRLYSSANDSEVIPLWRRSLILPTNDDRFITDGSDQTVSEARRIVNDRAKEMIADLESSKESGMNRTDLLDHSPFRPSPNTEISESGRALGGPDADRSQSARGQPPLSLKPLDLGNL